MLTAPCFHPKFRVERVPPDQVFLLSERDRFFLQGKLYYELAPLLDGKHSTEAIITALAPIAPQPTNIYYALLQLEKQGYLTEGVNAEGAEPNEAGPNEASLNREHSKVRLCISTTAPDSVRQGLRGLAHRLADALETERETERDTEIVLTDDYLHPDLAQYNARALESGQAWLLVKPLGEELWLGPHFRPGATGCWECLAQRLRGNRPVEQWLESLEQRQCLRQAQPRTDDARLAIAQQQILSALNPNHPYCHELQGQLMTVLLDDLEQNLDSEQDPDLKQHESQAAATLLSPPLLSPPDPWQRHSLTQRPQCVACGQGEDLRSPQVLRALPEPLQLQSCPKTFTADGGHRSQSPEATLQQLAPQVSRIVGVVRSLRAVAVDGSTVDSPVAADPVTEASTNAPLTHPATLLHTYITGHDSGEVSRNLEALKLNLQGRSAGKGKTRTQAKVSGICEAIERYSGIFQGDEPRRPGSYQSLQAEGKAPIHPNWIMGFSEAQYANRDAWNASQSDMRHYVPEPFDPEAEIEWSPLWSLTQKRFRYLPTAQCYYGYSAPEHSPPSYSALFCKANSNGCAAGNNREEAILQGFLELVERDAVAIWWGNQAQRPGVDLTSFDDPYFVALQEHYFEAYGRTLYVLDLTHDLGIPVAAAVSHVIDADVTPDGRPDQKILCGFGAHFEGAIAISRALTEVNQLLTGSVDPKNRTGNDPPQQPQPPTPPASPTSTVEPYRIYLSLVDQPHLMANPMLSPMTQDSMPAICRDDLREDVQACVDIVRQAGMEMLVLDQTRPDIGLPVVRVVVPGMRHFWRRLAPGRLYDVPIEQGWFLNPRWESRQNPLPFPF